jgi:hypothetical protein
VIVNDDGNEIEIDWENMGTDLAQRLAVEVDPANLRSLNRAASAIQELAEQSIGKAVNAVNLGELARKHANFVGFAPSIVQPYRDQAGIDLDLQLPPRPEPELLQSLNRKLEAQNEMLARESRKTTWIRVLTVALVVMTATTIGLTLYQLHLI